MTDSTSAAVRHLPRQRVGTASPAGPAVHGSLALTWAPEPPPADTVGAVGAVEAVDPAEDAALRSLAGRFAQAAVEVVAGQRPVLQLLRWTDEHVYADLERRAAAAARARGTAVRRVQAQVRSVHVCRPTADSAEVSVHVRHGERSRALALRLERHRDRWRCTVLLFG